MASKIGLTYKREAATNRLQAATNKLRSRGVAVGGAVTPLRDPDAQAVQELEQTADLLEAVVAWIDALQHGAPPRVVAVEVEMPGIDDLVRYAADQYATRTGAEVPVSHLNGIAAMAVELWRDGWSEIEGDAPAAADADFANYADRTVAELRDLIKEREIDVPSDARKADLVAALEQADAEADAEAVNKAEADTAGGVEPDADTDEGD